MAKKQTKKNISSNRESELQQMKAILVSRRQKLLSEADAALNSIPDETTYPDMGDQASAEIDRTFLLKLRSREQKLLKKIDSAIELIDAGEYGICEVCGEEIDFKRLVARPVTTMCIDCKTEQEEEEKLRL
ncbi:MAG: RNA polymerase-binding protein DksA [Nitrospirae bacterium]|nr:RNA polymerase-binding protein DksA [Nitrospirota bacterium]